MRARGKPETWAELEVTITDHAHYAVVTVVGEVDVTTGSDLRAALYGLLQRGVHHHIVDLRGVTFLDSTGLGILVGDLKRLRDRQGSVQVVCGPGLVGRVFRLTAVDKLIPVHDSVERAAAMLAASDTA
jgi:anti-anti-sigma factor